MRASSPHIDRPPFAPSPFIHAISASAKAARASGWMRPHLNARTYIGEMFNFMGHFAELYVGPSQDCPDSTKKKREKKRGKREKKFRLRRRRGIPPVSLANERKRETPAFGEIKKQLVPRAIIPHQLASSLSSSRPGPSLGLRRFGDGIQQKRG